MREENHVSVFGKHAYQGWIKNIGVTMARNEDEHWFSKVATQTANGSGRP
jgi:hypothetical protein